jgi:hypothetical protein
MGLFIHQLLVLDHSTMVGSWNRGGDIETKRRRAPETYDSCPRVLASQILQAEFYMVLT